MSNQTAQSEANDSDRPKDEHAVGFSVSLDDRLWALSQNVFVVLKQVISAVFYPPSANDPRATLRLTLCGPRELVLYDEDALACRSKLQEVCGVSR